MPEINPKQKLVKAGYRLVGSHSAVKICRWTKESLRKGRVCYKQKFYKIESHRCMQMTPALQCNFACKFCWRFHNINKKLLEQSEKIDEPKEILDGCIEEQRKLLSGFGGYSEIKKEKFKEALQPKHLAISLDGEPTLYPKLSELVEEATKRNITTFLVTNGTMPKRLEELSTEPTSLYISLCAPDKTTFKKINIPLIPDAWERLNESLELMKSFNTRTVIRHTLVKGLNMKEPEKYTKLILKAEPNFIECKGYMWVGESRQRLKMENMPIMSDVRQFAQKLSEEIEYKIKDEDTASRVVLLSKS